MPPPKKNKKIKLTSRAWANFWLVHERTMSGWIKNGIDPSNPHMLHRWLETLHRRHKDKLPESFLTLVKARYELAELRYEAKQDWSPEHLELGQKYYTVPLLGEIMRRNDPREFQACRDGLYQ